MNGMHDLAKNSCGNAFVIEGFRFASADEVSSGKMDIYLMTSPVAREKMTSK